MAPCIGKADTKQYNREVASVKKILTGDTDKLIREFSREMNKSSSELDYEKAAEYRDLIRSINSINEEQKVEDFDTERRDYISLVKEDNINSFVVLQMRNGKLSGKSVFSSEILSDPAEAMTGFLIQYYDQYLSKTLYSPESIPAKITVNILPETELFSRFYSDKNISLTPRNTCYTTG